MPEGEEDSRPYPQPEHSLAPRKPRTLGGLVYLGVLVATLTGVVVVALGEWRSGLTTIGVAVLVGGFGRLVLPNANAGMLGIRRKLIDVVTLVVLGGCARRPGRGHPGPHPPLTGEGGAVSHGMQENWHSPWRLRHGECQFADIPWETGRAGPARQMRPRSVTASRSSVSSAAVASILPREKSSISRPWTISQSPFEVVTGNE